jgi:hypothetical protein
MIAIGMICERKDDIRKTCHFDAGFPTKNVVVAQWEMWWLSGEMWRLSGGMWWLSGEDVVAQ